MAAVDGQVMTSLVVDPPNGRVPLLPHTSKAPPPDPNRADNPEDRNPGERCLGHPAGPPMVGGATGGNPCLQVVQTPGYVVLYSVGWWEGDTLVVESTNFESGTNPRGFGVAPGMGVFTRPDFHLIERFSMAAPDVLVYEFTVTNPKFFSQRCTALSPGEDRCEDVRVCLPRRERRAGVHLAWCAGGGERGATTRVIHDFRNTVPRA
jgi:hypothetical protein